LQFQVAVGIALDQFALLILNFIHLRRVFMFASHVLHAFPKRTSVFTLVLLSLFVLGSAVESLAQSFSTPTSYTVGTNPNDVKAGDLNGDGKPDLIVSNQLSDNVSVLLNNGDGTFGAAVNYPTGSQPFRQATGDLNGDGKLDVAVGALKGGTIGTGSIEILRGNGDGTFQPAVSFNTPEPDDIVVADVNGDSKLDIVIVTAAPKTASVFLGNGNGTFQAAITFQTGGQNPSALVVADFNNDGKPDLAATNAGLQNISVMIGNGNGTFQTSAPIAGGSMGIISADLNADNKIDLISTLDQEVIVNLGNGNGTFAGPVSYGGFGNSFIFFSPPVTADFNGDGKLDLAICKFIAATLHVLRGNGDGTFQPPTISFPTKPNPSFALARDLDSDGKPDIALASSATEKVNILLNSPTGHGVAFNPTATVPVVNAVVANFKDYDTTKTHGNFAATINWGDATGTSTGTVFSAGDGTFNIAGSHTYAKEGAYNLQIQLTDTSGNFASIASTVTVADAPLTPVGKTISGVKGQSLTAVVASFTDADPTGSASEFSALINWGDSTSSAGTIAANGSGGFNVTGTHTYSNSGTFPISVAIQAMAGSTATANSTANISPPLLQFSLANYSVGESGGNIQITVVRIGDTSGSPSVDYATSDAGAAPSCVTVNGKASSRCDFTASQGSLQFAAGETSKTFTVLISQDSLVEGPEILSLTLSNVSGDAVLGSPATATLTIIDDATEPATNPIDDSTNFVRQHYLDFLNREPDTSGLNFWVGEIDNCTPKPQCTEIRRINVSAAFFLSIEFQQTGYLVYRMYKSAYGNIPGTPVPVRLSEFLPDTQTIGRGVVIGQPGAMELLENNKQEFALAFVSRSRFVNGYPTTLTPNGFVDGLFANAGVIPTTVERDLAVAEFAGAVNTAVVAARARVLRRVADNARLVQQDFNKAFVLMEYFGYLRRNPNDAPEAALNFDGYNFWLGKLNQFDGNYINAEMVKAFLASIEYRQRFAP
jgi:hypothetical protein